MQSAPQRPTTRWRETRAEASRLRILEAAELEFAEHSFEGARIHDIADRAQMAIGTLYASFAGKQELFLAVQTRRLEELFRTVAEATGEAEGACDAVYRGLRALTHFFCERPAYLAMHLRDGQAWSSAMHLRTEIQQRSHAEGIALMRGLLAEAAQRGELVADDPELDARTLIAMHQVAMAHWLESRPRPDAEQLFQSVWARVARAFRVTPTALDRACHRDAPGETR